MNRWTILTVAWLVVLAATVVNAVWFRTWDTILGAVIAVVMSFWIVGGSARRGDPLARWLFHGRTFDARG
jgi:hypothetical protein